MKDDGTPTNFYKDPTANAIMNVAEEIRGLAQAVNGLLYGLKYSKQEGMSIAEAIEKAGDTVAGAMESK